MTEYKCGSAETCQFGEMCKPNYDIGGCSHYKAKRPQTNEEWLRSLGTTEELADAIYNMVITHPWSFNKEVVLRWLKEKHKE